MAQQQIPRRGEPSSGNPQPAPREGERERERERPAEPAAAGATPSRASKKRPKRNLNLYMRGVAVTSLLIVGGVGVYKGRNMLGSKDADKSPTEKVGEKGKLLPLVAGVDSSAPGSKKTGPALASIDKKHVSTPSAAKPAATDKKVSALGKFKFGGFDKSAATSDTASSPKPAASGGGYSLNDTPAPANDEGGYSADTAGSSDTGGYGGYSATAATDPAPITDSGYGGTTPLEAADSPAGDYGAAPPDAGYGAAAVSEDPYASPVEPAPAAPSYGASDSYGAAPPAESTSPIPSPPATGTPAGDVSPRVKPKPRFGSLPASPSAKDLTKKPSTLPPNKLPTSPLESGVAPRNAPASPRYADSFGSSPPGEFAPAVSGAVLSGAATSGAAVRPELEGVQTPTIAVEKFAPAEVQVGKAALFEIVVRNVGKVPAYDVTVTDEVPSGTRFQQASPQATQAKNGSLVWKLGAMQPGEEHVIELQLVPEAEGEIGSVAQVSFQAQAGSRSVVTRPKLEIRHEAAEKIHAGESAAIRLTITNTGTGAASNVLLQSDVPEGFSHPAGRELEFEVGTLRPGESKQVDLQMKAEQAGQYENVFVVRGDGDLLVQDTARVEIVAPSLQVGVTGPKKRFVERQATHTITFANPGTAAAKDVDLVAYLPRGFKFVSADNQGQYDSRQHAVVWGVEELAPSAQASVQLTTLPVEDGEQKLRVEARSANGLSADFEQLVMVDSVAEISVSIADLADPIEVASDTVYEIRLSNRGAKDATSVVIDVAFPTDLKPLEAEGDAQATLSGQNVRFAAIERIAPGSEVVLKVHAQGLRAGDHRISVSLTSDDVKTPITREESTRVYADQ